MGSPTAGTAAAGERLLEACVSALSAQLGAALTETTPLEAWRPDPGGQPAIRPLL